MANINVQLKNAGGDILYPQTDWNLVQNKPSINVIDKSTSQQIVNATGSREIFAAVGVPIYHNFFRWGYLQGFSTNEYYAVEYTPTISWGDGDMVTILHLNYNLDRSDPRYLILSSYPLDSGAWHAQIATTDYVNSLIYTGTIDASLFN